MNCNEAERGCVADQPQHIRIVVSVGSFQRDLQGEAVVADLGDSATLQEWFTTLVNRDFKNENTKS